MVKPKKKKKATKNEKGYSKILNAVTEARDNYENAFPFAVDYDNVSTPEGLPSFSSYRNSSEADDRYNEVDGNYRFTQTTPLPASPTKGGEATKPQPMVKTTERHIG